ncbi:MAG: serine/threonine protein kinase [Deltaproteobacteria bacterium]|nr:serine/threonine protein kinase [Deltaproteobacteria bacterium]
MQLAVGTDIDGRYVVEGHIGSGGMAEVYRVRHHRLGTLCALKVLTMTKRAVQRRLMQEGRVQATLQHPNIVRVSDLFLIGDAPCLVMEYVRGPSLEAFLPHWTFTHAQLDAVASGMLDGVGAAHALGLIHRDLKPANVMLDPTPTGLVPKVADFGLVKMVGGEGDGVGNQTRTGATMGSPAYMPPEQILDAKNVDHRADVWSLGALFYELLTGSRPFEGESIYEIFERVSAGRYAPVRSLVPDAPERMVRAIEGSLVLDREARWPSVEALSGAWLEGAPTPSRPIWPEEALRLARELGGEPEETRQALERSFREGEELHAVGTQGAQIFNTFEDLGDLPAFDTMAPGASQVPSLDTIAPAASQVPEVDSGLRSAAALAPATPPARRTGLAWIGLGLVGAIGIAGALVFASGEHPTPSEPGKVVTQPARAKPRYPSGEAPSPASEEPVSSPPEVPTSSGGTSGVERPEAEPEPPPGEADAPSPAEPAAALPDV